MILRLLSTILIISLLTACAAEETSDLEFEHAPPEPGEGIALAAEQLAFWNRIQQHCGNAYEGKVADATPFYAGTLEAETIKIHFRDCTDRLTHISLHIDDDHSRNLLLTKTATTLRLKHDHRYEDGSEEEITQYGGDAPSPGLETRQIFEADDHTEEILPERFDNFWFLDFMDDSTFAYGVHWPKHGNSIRIEFDITNTVDAPPAPWGYED